MKSSVINYKNKFRIVIMVVTYVVGLTLNFFGMSQMRLEQYKYGVSFWVFLSSLLAFLLALIWENRKMSKIEKRELMIKLMEDEKAMLRGSK